MCRVRGMGVGSVSCGCCDGGMSGFVVSKGLWEGVPEVRGLWNRGGVVVCVFGAVLGVKYCVM